MYCGNCIVSDGDRIICLRCAAKRIRPRPSMGKYAKLSIFLAKRAKFESEVTLSFSEVEGIIGGKLPESSYSRRSWWSNVRGRSPSEAWLTVGWRVKEVDLEGGRVTFVKEEGPKAVGPREAGVKRVRGAKAFKALALKAGIASRGPRIISKTRIAILQARLKNIERARRRKRGSVRHL